jgi:transcriptional regulator with XRE-family HTH domain
VHFTEHERKEPMIDSRKTGAYISKLRKEKDWTQLDLSDRLHVTPQAVSRWETGDSFPDLSTIVEIGKVFHVSVDDLLNGEPGPASRVDIGRRVRWSTFQGEREQVEAGDGLEGPSALPKATTGEVLTELAQGQTELVARLVSEGKADLESVIEAGPLARPSMMNEVVSRLTMSSTANSYAFTMEQIVALAPFISQDLLSAIMAQAIEENVDMAVVSDLAPFLNQEALDRLVDQAVTGEIDGSVLVGLAPFLSREKLDSLVEGVKAGTLDQSHFDINIVEAMAPFLSRETLDGLVEEIADQEIDANYLSGLAPFLSRETCDHLVDRIKAGTFEKAHLEELAPFLSAETLERLLFEEMDGKVDLEMLRALAPFLRHSTLQKLLQMVEGGSITPDVIVELAPFLDKETLTALIQGMSTSNAQPNPAD